MGKKSRKGTSESSEYQLLTRDLIRAKENHQFKELANIYNQLGHLERRRGDFEAAIRHHKDEKEITKKYNSNDRIGLGVAYRNIGEVYMEMGKEEEASAYFDKYLNIAYRENDLVEQQRAHITIGRLALSLVDRYSEAMNNRQSSEDAELKRGIELTRAEKEFKLALEKTQSDGMKKLLKEKELAEMKCGTFHNLGVVYEFKNELVEAKSWFQRALSVAKSQEFSERWLISAGSMFNVHVKEKDFYSAHALAAEMVKISKKQDKVSQAMAKLCHAKANIFLGEVDNGLNMLKRLRKEAKELALIDDYPMEEIEDLMKIAIKLRRAEDEKLACDAHDTARLQRINENIGDLLVEIGDLKGAVESYKLSINNAKDATMEGKSLAVLYYSVAQTYKDMGEYSQALEYHYKELDAYAGIAKEEFRTQMNIAECLEKLGATTTEVAEAYKKAIKYSKPSSKYEKQGLIALAKFYGKNGKLDISEDYMQRADLIPVTEDQLEDDSQDLLGDEDPESVSLDLDELSPPPSESEEEEEAVEEVKGVRVSSRRSRISFRKNEKGETPLHVAAQKGDVRAVRSLIAKGHEINPRDYAGWIPLHEACNFGHYEVVLELLKNKARVNDPGGPECRGITPLHDAASNGHFKVIESLIEHGAKAVVKDKDNCFPLDMLIGWYLREKAAGNLSEDQVADFRVMKDRLANCMRKEGYEYTKKDETRAAKKVAQIRDSSPEFSLLKTATNDAVPVTIRVVDPDENEGRAGVREYDEAMSNLRRRATRGDKDLFRRHSRGEKKEALLGMDEVVANDWLVPDEYLAHESSKVKRKRDPFDDLKLAERKAKRTGGSNRNALASIDVVRDRSPDPPMTSVRTVEAYKEIEEEDEMISSPGPSSSHSPETNITMEADEDDELFSRIITVESDRSTSDDEVNFFRRHGSAGQLAPKSRNLSRRPRQSKLTFKRVSSKASLPDVEDASNHSHVAKTSLPSEPLIQETMVNSSTTLRLNVTVRDKLIRVPVTQPHKTIDWLCEEVCSRYQQNNGSSALELKIVLKTKDGALLLGSDTIETAISEKDTELVAEVIETCLIALNTRFSQACNRENVVPTPEIKTAIDNCDTSESLILTDILLKVGICKALALSLRHAVYLRYVNLAGCSLRDSGITEFSGMISTLPNLEKLDLSCNGITSIGFKTLVKVFHNSGRNPNDATYKPPMHLKELVMSHNSLRNSICEPLVELLKSLRQLQELELVDCALTASLFSQNRRDLIFTINESQLEKLDLSYNHFGKGSLTVFLDDVNKNRLIVTADCCD